MSFGKVRLLTLALCTAFAACESTEPDTTPVRLVMDGGFGQVAAAGTKLPQPLLVRVLNASDEPVSNVEVVWAVTAGGGTLSATSTSTDANGEARVEWTLGTVAGEQTVTATAAALPPQSFTAIAEAGALATLTASAALPQQTTVGQRVEVGVRAQDAHGNAVSGATVNWQVTAGGGEATASSTTDAQGVARASWTLGTTPGSNTLTATAGGQTVTFSSAPMAGPVRTLVVDPREFTIPVGKTRQLAATARDAYGNVVPAAITWTSSAPSVVRVDSTGLVRAESVGSATVSAVGGGQFAFANVSVVRDTTVVSGTLDGNAAWNGGGSPYRINGTVVVPFGDTLTIEAGTQVLGGTLEVQGALRVSGSAGSRVQLTDVTIMGRGSAAEPFSLEVVGASVLRGSIHSSTSSSGAGSLVLRDSRVTDVARQIYLVNPRANSYIERNVFLRSAGIVTSLETGDTVFIRNNSFYEQGRAGGERVAVTNLASPGTAATVVELNSFWSTDRYAVSLPIVVPVGSGTARLSATNNFWNTTDTAVIEGMIFDQADNADAAGTIAYLPFLTASHPDTPVQ